MKRIVVAGYARSPFTLARKGELASVRPDDLAAQVVGALVARTGIPAEDIEDLLLGCAFPEGEQGLNLARLVSLMAGLPKSLGAATVNRFCGSSMTAAHIAAGAIRMDAGEVFIAAGVESMSRVPMMGFNPLPASGVFRARAGRLYGHGRYSRECRGEMGGRQKGAGRIRVALARTGGGGAGVGQIRRSRLYPSKARRARSRRMAASVPKRRSKRWPG